jgi:uncharacterized protein (DUF58 family)
VARYRPFAPLADLMRARMAQWIRRRQGLDHLPVRLERRRLYILPTRVGLAFAGLLLLMLLAGMNYANSLALFLTFLLGAFALVVMQQCHRNLLGTEVAACIAPAVFAGSTGAVHVTLASGAGEARPRLATAYPFGLFRAWTWMHTPIEMLVYPRPRGALPMPGHAGRRSGTRSLPGAGADEWAGLRPFRDGDSPRQVDWKAYAREAPLLVKEYAQGESELRMFDFASLAPRDVETRLSQLARWVVDAEARGERYGLVLPAVRLAPDRGPAHRHRCLAALATFGVEDGR